MLNGNKVDTVKWAKKEKEVISQNEHKKNYIMNTLEWN